MNKIVKILMERDNLSQEEAQEQFEETQEEITTAVEAGNFFEVEEILAANLGLELDYIFDILPI